MKLSAVYRSPKKIDTYLYVSERDDFSRVPSVLMKQFGTPQFVMMVIASKRETIAGIDSDKFIKKIETEGFYLQLPPKVKSLLDAHKLAQNPTRS
jgi:uncharacterized protein YcgL (UPF0745 family)